MLSLDCRETNRSQYASQRRNKWGEEREDEKKTHGNLPLKRLLRYFRFLQTELVSLALGLESLQSEREEVSFRHSERDEEDGKKRTIILSRRGCWLRQACLAICALAVACFTYSSKRALPLAG